MNFVNMIIIYEFDHKPCTHCNEFKLKYILNGIHMVCESHSAKKDQEKELSGN